MQKRIKNLTDPKLLNSRIVYNSTFTIIRVVLLKSLTNYRRVESTNHKIFSSHENVFRFSILMIHSPHISWHTALAQESAYKFKCMLLKWKSIGIDIDIGDMALYLLGIGSVPKFAVSPITSSLLKFKTIGSAQSHSGSAIANR